MIGCTSGMGLSSVIAYAFGRLRVTGSLIQGHSPGGATV